MHAIDILTYGHRGVLASVDNLPEGEWETPGVCGIWSVKNIIAHLASYELVLVDTFHSFGSDDPTPYLDQFREPGGAFNDAQVASRQSMTVTETLAEYVGAHERLMPLAKNIPADLWTPSGTIPWYGEPYALDDLVVYMA